MKRRRGLVPFAMGLMLVACNTADEEAGTRSEDPATEARSPAGARRESASKAPSAAPSESAAASPAAPEQIAPLPPRNQPHPAYVGRWAADEKLCASQAWRFTERMLHTPAGSVCSFDDVVAVPGGYDIKAHCTAEATQQADVIEIRFAQSAGAMLFDSKTISAVGLIKCGA